jgi:hypothetical protein
VAHLVAFCLSSALPVERALQTPASADSHLHFALARATLYSRRARMSIVYCCGNLIDSSHDSDEQQKIAGNRSTMLLSFAICRRCRAGGVVAVQPDTRTNNWIGSRRLIIAKMGLTLSLSLFLSSWTDLRARFLVQDAVPIRIPLSPPARAATGRPQGLLS